MGKSTHVNTPNSYNQCDISAVYQLNNRTALCFKDYGEVNPSGISRAPQLYCNAILTNIIHCDNGGDVRQHSFAQGPVL